MKLSTKKFGSIATAAVLAGTMAFMPATALATATTVSSTATGLTKNWEVPSAAQFTDETFNFTLHYNGNPDPVGSNPTADPTGLGENNSKTVSLTKSEFSGDGTKTATKTFAQLFDGISFSKPGTYSFTLTEQRGTNQNIVYDTNTSYTVKVEVTWATGSNGAPTSDTQIASVLVYDAAGKIKKSEGATFNNTDPNGNLTVSKTVKGTAANTTDVFTFQAALKDKTGADLTGSYKFTKTAADGTTTGDYTLGTDFTLKSGETFRIENLPEGATYTVTETDTNGYDSTDVEDEDDTTAANVEKDAGTPTGKGVINDGHTDTVAFTNNKGFTAATGITMNTLPFVAVGVVAVAGGAALVISRRRHAGEDF